MTLNDNFKVIKKTVSKLQPYVNVLQKKGDEEPYFE